VDDTDRRLLNRIQSDFPLVPRPFGRLGEELGLPEDEVIRRVAALCEDGLIRRIGPVLDPARVGRLGALAAMTVPAGRVESVATTVSQIERVTHNYERAPIHGTCPYNLWFTLTAEAPDALAATLGAVEKATRLPVVVLPVLRKFKIGVRFSFPEEGGDG